MDNKGNRSFEEALCRRGVLILDGAVGTMLMGRGASGCERLNVSQPDVVACLHRQYVAAGADIITTNTTCANGMMCHDGMAALVARRGAEIAVGVARECSARRVWVAGSMGGMWMPLTKYPERTAEAEAAFREQAEALMQGGVDLLLVETCFDVQNALAAMRAISGAEAALGRSVPVVVSGTVADAGGRLASGDTLEQLYEAVSEVGKVAAFGLNCSFGVESGLDGLVARLSDGIDAPIVLYPSAGMPDSGGRYATTADRFAEVVSAVVLRHGVKVAGGCCGTTPECTRRMAVRLKAHG